MKTFIKLMGAALAGALPVAAIAADTASCSLSYDVYEASVPHTDMETCPTAILADGAYCRVSVVAEVATIFVFSEEDDCLIKAESFFEDDFTLTFK